jgi:nicotinamidase-related amidase
MPTKNELDLARTAVLFIGYQNDYFATDGILRDVIEKPGRAAGILSTSVALIEALQASEALLASTPILFTPDYSELVEPVGILAAIRSLGAFKAGEKGSETIPELKRFGDRIMEVPGKRGLNAFSNTKLDEIFRRRGIRDVVLAGVVTSICIDSTGRAAHERGYRVHVLSDCTAGRSTVEQSFYCESIFPLYANVIESDDLFGNGD